LRTFIFMVTFELDINLVVVNDALRVVMLVLMPLRVAARRTIVLLAPVVTFQFLSFLLF